MIAWISGVEPNRQSPAYGQVVCPKVTVWKDADRSKVLAQLPHGRRVRIVAETTNKTGRKCCQIKFRQGLFSKTGWVTDNFIVKE